MTARLGELVASVRARAAETKRMVDSVELLRMYFEGAPSDRAPLAKPA